MGTLPIVSNGRKDAEYQINGRKKAEIMTLNFFSRKMAEIDTFCPLP